MKTKDEWKACGKEAEKAKMNIFKRNTYELFLIKSKYEKNFSSSGFQIKEMFWTLDLLNKVEKNSFETEYNNNNNDVSIYVREIQH